MGDFTVSTLQPLTRVWIWIPTAAHNVWRIPDRIPLLLMAGRSDPNRRSSSNQLIPRSAERHQLGLPRSQEARARLRLQDPRLIRRLARVSPVVLRFPTPT